MVLMVHRIFLLLIDLNLKASTILKNFQEQCILLKMWEFITSEKKLNEDNYAGK